MQPEAPSNAIAAEQQAKSMMEALQAQDQDAEPEWYWEREEPEWYWERDQYREPEKEGESWDQDDEPEWGNMVGDWYESKSRAAASGHACDETRNVGRGPHVREGGLPGKPLVDPPEFGDRIRDTDKEA